MEVFVLSSWGGWSQEAGHVYSRVRGREQREDRALFNLSMQRGGLKTYENQTRILNCLVRGEGAK